VGTAGVTPSPRVSKVDNHIRSRQHQIRNRLPHRKHKAQKSPSHPMHQQQQPEQEIF